MRQAVWVVHHTQNAEGHALVDIIAHCARVSNPANQANHATAPRLIKYLIEHRHWSPFEMAHICLGITTTRAISRQLLRHRSFTFQEFSQRYAAAPDISALQEPRRQDTRNRQSSLDVAADDPLHAPWLAHQGKVIEAAQKAYAWALAQGMAKEVARAVLPEGTTLTTLYMNGSLRSWLHYLEGRLDGATQKEHRELAGLIYAQIDGLFPLAEFI